MIRKHILEMYENKRILSFNPRGMCKKLDVDLKDVLKECISLEKEDIVDFQLIFICDCGFSKTGDMSILGEECEFCENEISESNTMVEYKFIRK